MTKDEIIEFAEKAGLLRAVFAGDEVLVWEAETKHLQRFADLVAKNEREACAKAAEDFLTSGRSPLGRSVAVAIRARGEGK
jgi:antitoxin (DNA-binding transcriptional repressor) of toxin-antitoxin stability system